MRILVTGIHGTAGQALSNYLIAGGHTVVGVSRSATWRHATGDRNARLLSWEQVDSGILADCAIDGVVNFAGAPMIQHWDSGSKRLIIHSRAHAIRTLWRAITALPRRLRPEFLINASSVAIYSSRDSAVDETTDPIIQRGIQRGKDRSFFQAQVWNEIESLTCQLRTPGVRCLIARMGLLIGPSEMLRSMMILYRYCMGAVLGSGRQKISWISHIDMARALEQLMLDGNSTGVFNIVSPQTISARELSIGIAESLKRPVLMRVPERLLKLALGELASNFLISAEVRPSKLESSGFDWVSPDFFQTVLQTTRDLGFSQKSQDSGKATTGELSPPRASA